jgi:hypothetical protein
MLKWILNEEGLKHMDWIIILYSCERANEASVSSKGGEFLNKLNDY